MSGRTSTYSLLVLFALLASALHFMKYEVQALRDRNKALYADIAQERDALHMLQAEWVYLNRPARLEALAQAHLSLLPVDTQRIVALPHLIGDASRPALPVVMREAR